MLINVYGSKCIGTESVPVTVEVKITSGIGIHLVGLADTAVKESLLRTTTALQSLGFRIPGRKIVINLAPADIHKKGSGYDLPIAAGIVAASGQRDLPEVGKFVIMGELGLDGSVRPVPGALPIAEMALKTGFKGCILPEESAREAASYMEGPVFGVRDFSEVIRILEGKDDCGYLLAGRIPVEGSPAGGLRPGIPDFADVYGQEGGKRGLEIAAAGGHNVLMIGPPGSGKSTLAKAMAGILPPMSAEEALQTGKIYSVAGKGCAGSGAMRLRPFRSPHYNTSVPAMIGGGAEHLMPGEISLAHNGVLFLDEFCEMPRRVLEALRAPLEDRKVTVSRLRTKIEYPSSFMMVAAMNPCPCGYYGDGDRCTCSPAKRFSYLSKLSGPVLDRIDIHLWINAVETSILIGREKAEPSSTIAERVAEARSIQADRFRGTGIFTNAEMSGKMLGEYCPLSSGSNAYLLKVVDNMGLSARACHRIVKIARTIADLEGSGEIRLEHISEASGYRFLDKKFVFLPGRQ